MRAEHERGAAGRFAPGLPRISDGQIGFVGYEINFNRYFYRYTPPRPLEEIEADIRGIEKEILGMLSEVTGGAERQ